MTRSARTFNWGLQGGKLIMAQISINVAVAKWSYLESCHPTIPTDNRHSVPPKTFPSLDGGTETSDVVQLEPVTTGLALLQVVQCTLNRGLKFSDSIALLGSRSPMIIPIKDTDPRISFGEQQQIVLEYLDNDIAFSAGIFISSIDGHPSTSLVSLSFIHVILQTVSDSNTSL